MSCQYQKEHYKTSSSGLFDCQCCERDEHGWERALPQEAMSAPTNRARTSTSLPKHEHNQQFVHILSCLRELEQGVLDTAKSNEQYATELDSQQVKVSKIEPALSAALQENTLLQEHMDAAFERMRELEQETAGHSTARGNILGQLQDGLLREADLRSGTASLGKELDELRSRMQDSGNLQVQLEAKVKR